MVFLAVVMDLLLRTFISFVGMCPQHHLRGHKFVFEDLLGMNALAWVNAHDLVEEVHEVRVVNPFVAAEVEAFL